MKKFLLIATLLVAFSSQLFAQSNMNYVVKDDCFAATTQEAYKELSRHCNNKDQAAVMRMVSAGTVAVLKKGTNVRLEKSNIITSTVTVLDGTYKGYKVILSPSDINKK